MTKTSMGSLLWSVADLLRGDFKQSDFGKVILPFTVARRLDGLAAPGNDAVQALLKQRSGDAPPLMLEHAAGGPVYNVTSLTLEKMLGDSGNLAANLVRFSEGFPEQVREIFQRYKWEDIIRDLDEKDLLVQVTKRFASVDLDHIGNAEMGNIFEDLIRRFAELSNETAGEHFTPRDAVHLMLPMLFTNDDDILAKSGAIRTLYDPTAGTGGMLSEADAYVRGINPDATLALFGQELNDESYAICKADMLIKGHDPQHIQQGNTLTDDKHAGRKFDYVMSNPPFGVDWSKVQVPVGKEHASLGIKGRFGPGLPRKSDGTLLFMMHGLSKLDDHGRMAIVTNGSPLFTGNAGSGESNIRRWIVENDWLEAIIALPNDMFFNTGIQTYIWILTKAKQPERAGKVQLIDAGKLYGKMTKSLGNKRVEMKPEHIERIVKAHGSMEESDISKVLRNEELGYRTITVDRPMKHSYAASDERLARIADDRKLRKRDDLEEVTQALRDRVGPETEKNRGTFMAKVQLALAPLGLKATEVKGIVDLLAERDETAEPVRDGKKRLLPDTDLRDTEDVALTEDVQTFFERDVLPQAPDAWINDEVRDEKDGDLGKVGYEIPFNRFFYTYEAPPSLHEVDERIRERSARIMEMLKAVVG